MQRRNLLLASLLLATAGLAAAQTGPKIAVTDLAYTENVRQYFEVATGTSSGTLHAGPMHLAATQQSSGTYVAGTYSYMEQRELGSFTNDIKGAILKGGAFRLVQAKAFDAGTPQPTKAEQVLNQVKTGKMAQPVRQPQVKDIVDRIKKGEFPGADYVLFGTLSSLEFRDSLSPLQGTSSSTHQFTLDLVADFSLINTKTLEIKSAFSAQGNGGDIKMLSNRGDVQPPNRGKVMRETSQSLALSVYQQMADQLGLPAPMDPATGRVTPPNAPPQPTKSEAVILR